MSASQTIADEVAKVLSTNSLYRDNKKSWRYLLESYLGGEEYTKAGHLVKYANETSAEYAARLNNTPLDNHCQSVVSVYTSFLFRETPYRDLGSLEGNPMLRDFMRDCDYEGRTLDHFMKDLSNWISVFGHAWMILSKPNIGATTQAQEVEMNNRPYLSMLTPLVVIDWSWSRDKSGRYTLDYLKYIEDVNGDIQTIKEWTNDTILTHVVDTGSNDFVTDTVVEENGLGRIPAVICYNKRTSVRGLGVSDIKDIADQQKFIYNAKSEVDQSIRLNSHPSLVKTESTAAGIGAGSIIQMSEDMDPALKPYLLEFNGASIESIYKAIAQAETAIDKIANIGAVRVNEAVTMSGVAMETEFQLLNSRLADKAHSIELAEENMWQLWAEYMNATWNGTIDYPNSFNIRDGAYDLEMYTKVLSLNVPSGSLKKELYKMVADLAIDDADKLKVMKAEIDAYESHAMYNPTTGEMMMVSSEDQHNELVSQGWVNA